MMTMEGSFCFAVFFALLHVVESTEQPCEPLASLHFACKIYNHLKCRRDTRPTTLTKTRRCNCSACDWRRYSAAELSLPHLRSSVAGSDGGDQHDSGRTTVGALLGQWRTVWQLVYSTRVTGTKQVYLLRSQSELDPDNPTAVLRAAVPYERTRQRASCCREKWAICKSAVSAITTIVCLHSAWCEY